MTGDDFDLTVRCIACGDTLTLELDCPTCDELNGLAEAPREPSCDFCQDEVYRDSVCRKCWADLHD